MTDTTTQNQQPSTTATSGGVFEQLVGPGKKFDSSEALAKGKLESDTFIKKVEDENRRLRELVDAQDNRLKSLEARTSILDRLNGDTQERLNTTAQTAPTSSQTPAEKGLSAEDVVKLIENRDRSMTERQNIDKVDKALFKTFGTEALAFVKQKAAEIGMAPEDLQAVAAKSPNAFFSMVGISPENNQNSQSMYQPRNTGSVGGKSEIRNKAYYDALQAKMGVKTFILDKGLQIQMHKDMSLLGDSWDAT